MDRERLEYALKIVASEPGSALDTAFSSIVNLIIENHEMTVNSALPIQIRQDSTRVYRLPSMESLIPKTLEVCFLFFLFYFVFNFCCRV